MKYLTIKIHNSYFHDAHEHFYTTHDATDIDFFFFLALFAKKKKQHKKQWIIFVQRGKYIISIHEIM